SLPSYRACPCACPSRPPSDPDPHEVISGRNAHMTTYEKKAAFCRTRRTHGTLVPPISLPSARKVCVLADLTQSAGLLGFSFFRTVGIRACWIRVRGIQICGIQRVGHVR